MIAFTMQMFEELIDAAPKLKTAYEAARGKVLEDELSRLVRGPLGTEGPSPSSNGKMISTAASTRPMLLS